MNHYVQSKDVLYKECFEVDLSPFD